MEWSERLGITRDTPGIAVAGPGGIMRTPAVLVLTLAATLPSGRVHAGGKPTSTLERATQLMAHTRLGASRVVVVNKRRFSLYLRPDAKLIGVVGGLFGIEERGFFLGNDGKLAAHDRDALERILAKEAPELDHAVVYAAMHDAARATDARKMKLEAQQPVVDALIDRAKAANGTQEVVVWEGKRGYVSYRPGTQGFIGHARWSQSLLSLDGSTAHDLRAFLVEHE